MSIRPRGLEAGSSQKTPNGAVSTPTGDPTVKHRILLQKMKPLERLKKTRFHQTRADNSEKGAHTDIRKHARTLVRVRWVPAVKGQSKEQRSKEIAGMEEARMNETVEKEGGPS